MNSDPPSYHEDAELFSAALPRVIGLSRGYGVVHATAIDRITALDPSIVLRALRSTRPQDSRKDEQETDPLRRRLLAAAHTALGRTDRAAKLLPSSQL